MTDRPMVAIVGLRDDEGPGDDWTAELIGERVAAAGGRVLAQAVIPRDEAILRRQLVTWISDSRIDIVFVTSPSIELACRAIDPLVTEPQRDRILARCGSTLVVALPPGAEGAVATLDRVISVPAPRPARISTGSIAVIGDLPPALDDSMIDLRRGGRRGLLAVGLVAFATLGAVAGVGYTIVQRNLAIAAASPSHELVEADAPAQPARVSTIPASPPAPAPSPAPQVSARAPQHEPKPVVSHVRTAKPAAAPAAIAHKRPPAAAEAPDPDPTPVDTMCDAQTCAASNYERECCVPFRPGASALVPEKLDRAMVAGALAGVKGPAHDCAQAASITDGGVKVNVTVRADGHVASVVLEDAPESGVGACVLAAIRGLTFPITEHGGSFAYRVEL